MGTARPWLPTGLPVRFTVRRTNGGRTWEHDACPRSSLSLCPWVSTLAAGGNHLGSQAFQVPQIKTQDVSVHSVFQISPLKCSVAQPYPTFCGSMDYSLPSCSVHGILQARIVEWGFPGGSGGKESACFCRRYWLVPWSGKIPYATEHLSPGTTTAEPVP